MTAYGTAHPRAKLDPDKVRAIREDKRSVSALAREYGVCRSTIDSILQGLTWVHVK